MNLYITKSEFNKQICCLSDIINQGISVSAGLTNNPLEALSSQTAQLGDNLHFYSPNKTLEFTVTQGSAIVGVDVTDIGNTPNDYIANIQRTGDVITFSPVGLAYGGSIDLSDLRSTGQEYFAGTNITINSSNIISASFTDTNDIDYIDSFSLVNDSIVFSGTGNAPTGTVDLTPYKNINYMAGSGINLSGAIFSHAMTSNITNVTNSGNNVLQSITFDSYGHPQTITSAEILTSKLGSVGITPMVGDFIFQGSGVSQMGNTFTITDNNTEYTASNDIVLVGNDFQHVDYTILDGTNTVAGEVLTGFTSSNGHITAFTTAPVSVNSYTGSTHIEVTTGNQINLIDPAPLFTSGTKVGTSGQFINGVTVDEIGRITGLTYGTPTGSSGGTITQLGTTVGNLMDGNFLFTGSGVSYNSSTQTFTITDTDTITSVNGQSGALTFNGSGVSSLGSTFNFNDTTYTAGTGLSLSGNTFLHANTSSLIAGTASATNQVVNSITYDGFGHIDSIGFTAIATNVNLENMMFGDAITMNGDETTHSITLNLGLSNNTFIDDTFNITTNNNYVDNVGLLLVGNILSINLERNGTLSNLSSLVDLSSLKSDGTETVINSGIGISVTGSGTNSQPYTISTILDGSNITVSNPITNTSDTLDNVLDALNTSSGSNVADMITDVMLSGSNLSFTGQNGAFNQAVDLSSLTNTYTAGTGISITGNVITNTVANTNNYITGASVSGTTTKTLTLSRLGLGDITTSWADLSNTYTAGTNIAISGANVISSTNTNDIDYINGSNLSGTTLNLTGIGNAGTSIDLSSLSTTDTYLGNTNQVIAASTSRQISIGEGSTLGIYTSGTTGTLDMSVRTAFLKTIGNLDISNFSNSGSIYIKPGADTGTSGQVLITDGTGKVSWATVGAGGTDTNNYLDTATLTSDVLVLTRVGLANLNVPMPYSTLPSGGTSGQLLSTDGSGNYSWVNDQTGTGGTTDTSIYLNDGTVDGRTVTVGGNDITWNGTANTSRFDLNNLTVRGTNLNEFLALNNNIVQTISESFTGNTYLGFRGSAGGFYHPDKLVIGSDTKLFIKPSNDASASTGDVLTKQADGTTQWQTGGAGGSDGYIGNTQNHTAGGDLNMGDNDINNINLIEFNSTQTNGWRILDGGSQLTLVPPTNGAGFYTINQTGTPAAGTDLVDVDYLDGRLANAGNGIYDVANQWNGVSTTDGNWLSRLTNVPDPVSIYIPRLAATDPNFTSSLRFSGEVAGTFGLGDSVYLGLDTTSEAGFTARGYAGMNDNGIALTNTVNSTFNAAAPSATTFWALNDQRLWGRTQNTHFYMADEAIDMWTSNSSFAVGNGIVAISAGASGDLRIQGDLPVFATHALADSNSMLSGSFYKLTGDRVVYQKP